MTDGDSRALLAEVLEFLKDRPRFNLRRGRNRNSDDLAARIEAYLALWSKPPHPAISVGREHWRKVGFLRVDADERVVEPAPDGYWIRSWLHIDSAAIDLIDEILCARYHAAVHALPELSRAILRAYMRENLSFAEIAIRNDLSVAEVEKVLAGAMLYIGQALDLN